MKGRGSKVFRRELIIFIVLTVLAGDQTGSYMTRIVLAMSGGVDSSVAAELLKTGGHEVVGVFMRHGEESAATCSAEQRAAGGLPVVDSSAGGGRADHKQGCCSATDAADARRVADSLDIPFYSLDLQADFRRIVDYFVDDYLAGRTPNPCVKCNHWIKFGRLFEFADSIDASFVATGHYARMLAGDDGPQMHRGLDDSKDQSYALFGIGAERLGRMMLPVGDFTKAEIRDRARRLGFGVAEKRDSQEICFVTRGHHSDFVKSRRPELVGATAGEIVKTDGSVVGRHQGFEAFTVGQRKGLGVALGSPHFVVRIEPDTRRVVLGSQDDIRGRQLVADQANWLVPVDSLPARAEVQIRYNGSPHAATLTLGDDPGCFAVEFDRPVAAIAPGQAAVVYNGSRVLGGGWIL